MKLDIPYEDICKLIEESGDRLIGLEIPEGLKRRAHDISREISYRTGSEVIISGNPCYGACDISDREFIEIGVDRIIQLGHSPILQNTEIPINYFPLRSNLDLSYILKEIRESIKGVIGLVTTAQFITRMDEIVESIEKSNDIEVVISDGDSRIKNPGQVLGCNFSAVPNNVDFYLYIGSGNFHPLGIRIAKDKKVLVADPEKNEVRKIDFENSNFLNKRYAQMEKAKNANTFGIILSTKKGQMRSNLAMEICKLIRSSGKEAEIISMGDITPGKLIQLGFDAYVSTACPRVAYDDSERFKYPLITSTEARMLFDDSGLEEYNYKFDVI